ASMRSNEADATTSTAGQAGGVLYAKCANTPGPGCAGGAVPIGATVCVAGPTPNQNFSLPDGTTRSLPLKNIAGTTRTDTSHPNASDQNITVGSASDHCDIPAPGLYEITADVQFTDLPTSLTPGPAA